MENLSLLKTLIFIGVAGVVTYFFTMPQLAEMRSNQEQTTLFQNEIERVSNVNSILSQLQSNISSLPISDRQKLDRFLPTSVDQLLILKEIEALLVESEIEPISLASDQFQSPQAGNRRVETAADANEFVTTTTISTTFVATYEAIQTFLSLTEQHPYVLQFKTLAMLPVEDDPSLVTVEAQIHVFSFKSTPVSTGNQ